MNRYDRNIIPELSNFANARIGNSFRVTLQRAKHAARVRRNSEVNMLHLIYSLTEDPDAVDLFNARGVDLDLLRRRSISSLNAIQAGEPAVRDPQFAADVVELINRATHLANATISLETDGRDVLGILMDDAELENGIEDPLRSLIDDWHIAQDQLIESSSWTGIYSKAKLSESAADGLSKMLSDVQAQLDSLAISNTEKSQALAYIVAAKALAQAPEPQADLIWELIGRLNALSGVAGLLVAIIALIK